MRLPSSIIAMPLLHLRAIARVSRRRMMPHLRPYPPSPIPYPLPMSLPSYERLGVFYLGREFDPATQQLGPSCSMTRAT